VAGSSKLPLGKAISMDSTRGTCRAFGRVARQALPVPHARDEQQPPDGARTDAPHEALSWTLPGGKGASMPATPRN
jgi:hypothetical protein